jgi:epoxide hydrolase-like predicted phosphatase
MYKVKAIIFDIGGVLELAKNKKTNNENHNLSIHENIAKKFRISVDQWFDAFEKPWSQSVQGRISEHEVIFILSKNLKTTPAKLKKIVINAYKNHFKSNEELYKLAFKLKEKGYKIGILSDQWALSKEAVVKQEYMKKFDKVVISCDAGMRKPEINIYKKILTELNIKPEEAVFIDNQIWNIEPAKQLGMKTILFENNEQTINELKDYGVKI